MTKFIGPDRAKYAVNNAQHKMGVMHERMEKATAEMRNCNDDCKYRTKIELLFANPKLYFILKVAITRKSVRELENYKEIDTFNSVNYEKELMKASRLKYDDPAGLRSKVVYTDVNFSKGYQVTYEYEKDPTNKGLQVQNY